MAHVQHIFSRDILLVERWGGLKIFMRPKREKQTTWQHKTYFPHFLWAITQIKPGKLKAFFLWNASINAVKKEQRDWGGMPHCCYFSCRPWPSYVWECSAVTKAHLSHAPRGGKKISVVHWRPLRLLVPLCNLCFWQACINKNKCINKKTEYKDVSDIVGNAVSLH